MEPENLQVLPLHKHPEYLQPCIILINEEWPRNETARRMSLKASCDNLPTSLILINHKKRLLGHCKLTKIPSMSYSCFIESVVISKDFRGKKLGTFLMKYVEEYCKDFLGLTMLHLSTKGQEMFYAKLGYEVCAPISIYGNTILEFFIPKIILQHTPKAIKKPEDECHENTIVPPPPPPPPPMLRQAQTSRANASPSKYNKKVYMCKYLSNYVEVEE